MASLKAYLPKLAPLLGTTPDALYERQRALVRAGLLDLGDSRGPGSGVRVSASSVALLLLSVLASERLGESEERVGALAAAVPAGRKTCPYTRAKTFGDALAHILSAAGEAARVSHVTVSRTADKAEVGYFAGVAGHKASLFHGEAAEPGISVTATLKHAILQRIADDVQKCLAGK
jgi:hypothetical protein